MKKLNFILNLKENPKIFTDIFLNKQQITPKLKHYHTSVIPNTNMSLKNGDSQINLVEKAKRAAAYQAIEENVNKVIP
jgi:hypothetical protein